MDVAEVKLQSALEQNKKLETALTKEKERNKKMIETLDKVTQHNIELTAQLQGIGGNINIIG